MAEARECVINAAGKVKARTRGEVQRAREKAAPTYLKGRVERGRALPEVEVVRQVVKRKERREEEERAAVCEYVVRWMSADLYVEMMQALRYRQTRCGDAAHV